MCVQFISKLDRKHCRMLVGLLTRHINLQYMLHKMRRAKTPSCRRCGVEKETSVHIPCECPVLENVRMQTLGFAKMDPEQIKETRLSGIVALRKLIESRWSQIWILRPDAASFSPIFWPKILLPFHIVCPRVLSKYSFSRHAVQFAFLPFRIYLGYFFEQCCPLDKRISPFSGRLVLFQNSKIGFIWPVTFRPYKKKKKR